LAGSSRRGGVAFLPVITAAACRCPRVIRGEGVFFCRLRASSTRSCLGERALGLASLSDELFAALARSAAAAAWSSFHEGASCVAFPRSSRGVYANARTHARTHARMELSTRQHTPGSRGCRRTGDLLGTGHFDRHLALLGGGLSLLLDRQRALLGSCRRGSGRGLCRRRLEVLPGG